MSVESFDVLIVGAGLSGIGAACHLQSQCPNHSWAILEARDRIGGTWDLFRYPGVRSDSDRYTFGYAFRPWAGRSVFAAGDNIRQYVQDTADEAGVTPHIRFGSRVVSANWNSSRARWELDVCRSGTSDPQRMVCRFLMLCSGYYRYDHSHIPEFPGREEFQGEIPDPQHWPGDLQYRGKNVVIIGSGATAVTLLPAMAEQAAHVTMLQRSPTYIGAIPSRDLIADALNQLLPGRLAWRLIRLKNVLFMTAFYQVARRWPGLMKSIVRRSIRRQLGPEFDIDRHFTPAYAPWDQRFCIAPDGDFFQALKQGSASVVTDQIQCFTRSGVRLQSGRELEADVIVPATGLELQTAGGMALYVDGQKQDASQLISYRGMMMSSLPNLAVALGYINASWTLKIDLICERVCRLLNLMDRKGYVSCVPVPPENPETVPLMGLTSGYVQRAVERMPRQGTVSPWTAHQNYFQDLFAIRWAKLEDGILQFSREPQLSATAPADSLPDETEAAS